MQSLLASFIRLFVAIDPLGTLPIFLSLTAGMPRYRMRQVTFEATFFGLFICIAFMFLGNAIFHFVGITPADFRIAGGIILLVLAVIDLLILGKPAVDEHASIGLFPLAMPLIAGPATLTSTLILGNSAEYGYTLTLIALILNFAILLAVFLFAQKIVQLIGRNALRAFSKVVMVLLTALAVNLIRVGVADAIREMSLL